MLSSSLNNISHRFNDIVFATQTITFVNNAAVLFNIIFNLKEWSSISSVPDNAEFTFIIIVCSTLVGQTLVRPSLSFFKIESLVFSDIVPNDSRPWFLVTDEARFLKEKFGSPNVDPMRQNQAQS